MMGKKVFLVIAAGALLLLPFADCMSALTQDQQAMTCCGSMPCAPANHGQDCCKSMVSAQTPNMLPAKHVSLHAPTLGSAEYARMLEVDPSAAVHPVVVEAQQHSPPDLYTLNASLLI